MVNEVSPIGYTGSVWLCQKYPKSFLSTKHARSWACNAVLGLVLKYAFYAFGFVTHWMHGFRVWTNNGAIIKLHVLQRT
jgi:hypothetical protein